MAESTFAAPWDLRESSIESLSGTGAIQRWNAREDAAQITGRPISGLFNGATDGEKCESPAARDAFFDRSPQISVSFYCLPGAGL